MSAHRRWERHRRSRLRVRAPRRGEATQCLAAGYLCGPRPCGRRGHHMEPRRVPPVRNSVGAAAQAHNPNEPQKFLWRSYQDCFKGRGSESVLSSL